MKFHTARPRRSLLLCLALGATLASGCNVIGVIADKAGGDLPVEPAHRPDPAAPLVVIVENYRDPGTNVSDAARVQQIVSDRLARNNVAPVISGDRLTELRDRSPTRYQKMSIVEVARAVDAKQVVYVDLTSVSVGSQIGGDALKGVASASVKLVDVATGTVLYPKDLDAGAGVRFESMLHRGSTEITPDRVRAETLVGLGERVAQLFHSYRRSDMERIQSYE